MVEQAETAETAEMVLQRALAKSVKVETADAVEMEDVVEMEETVQMVNQSMYS